MRTEAWLAVVAAGFAVLGVGGEPEAARRGPDRECTHALMVRGDLRCGDEAVAEAQACGLDPIAGDRIDACVVTGRMAPDDLQRLRVPIDINEAGILDLTSFHRIGPVGASRIAAGRPYTNAAELLRVRGIGPKTLAGMRERVVVSPPRVRSR